MNDVYRRNKSIKQPMATRKEYSQSEEILQSSWIDRLIMNMYIVLSGFLLAISIASLSNISG
tara:strand:+ start:420 stop:605 length:186 start_codon:yes stop_codon:yes gene_type:complete